MTNHTEGPWHYGEFPLTDSGNIYVWNDGESVLCAEVPTEEAGPDGAKANAALIAAAPEMLEALETALTLMHVYGHPLHFENLKRQIGDAIRKARDVSQFVDE